MQRRACRRSWRTLSFCFGFLGIDRYVLATVTPVIARTMGVKPVRGIHGHQVTIMSTIMNHHEHMLTIMSTCYLQQMRHDKCNCRCVPSQL